MSARPAILRWVGFVRAMHGAPKPRPLHRVEDVRERTRVATHDVLHRLKLRAAERART